MSKPKKSRPSPRRPIGTPSASFPASLNSNGQALTLAPARVYVCFRAAPKKKDLEIALTKYKLVLDDGGFLYSSDSYADDLPYWVNGPKGPHLIIPYTLDANDMRFINPQGFPEGEAFFIYLRDAFDFLYEEGAVAPKMMSVGLHCRLAGRQIGRAHV